MENRVNAIDLRESCSTTNSATTISSVSMVTDHFRSSIATEGSLVMAPNSLSDLTSGQEQHSESNTLLSDTRKMLYPSTTAGIFAYEYETPMSHRLEEVSTNQMRTENPTQLREGVTGGMGQDYHTYHAGLHTSARGPSMDEHIQGQRETCTMAQRHIDNTSTYSSPGPSSHFNLATSQTGQHRYEPKFPFENFATSTETQYEDKKPFISECFPPAYRDSNDSDDSSNYSCGNTNVSPALNINSGSNFVDVKTEPDLDFVSGSEFSQLGYNRFGQRKHKGGRTTAAREAGINDEDWNRIRRRRERNKMAAQRCREKKRFAANILIQENQQLESSNTSLKFEIKRLQQYKVELEDALHHHKCKRTSNTALPECSHLQSTTAPPLPSELCCAGLGRDSMQDQGPNVENVTTQTLGGYNSGTEFTGGQGFRYSCKNTNPFSMVETMCPSKSFSNEESNNSKTSTSYDLIGTANNGVTNNGREAKPYLTSYAPNDNIYTSSLSPDIQIQAYSRQSLPVATHESYFPSCSQSLARVPDLTLSTCRGTSIYSSANLLPPFSRGLERSNTTPPRSHTTQNYLSNEESQLRQTRILQTSSSSACPATLSQPNLDDIQSLLNSQTNKQ